MESERLRLVGDLLKAIEKDVHLLINSTEKPAGICMAPLGDYQKLDCESQLLGLCLRMLAKSGVWPLPAPEAIDVSLVELDNTITSLTPATTRTNHNGSHGGCYAIATPQRKLVIYGEYTNPPPYTTDYHYIVAADERKCIEQQARVLGTQDFLNSISAEDNKVQFPTIVMKI